MERFFEQCDKSQEWAEYIWPTNLLTTRKKQLSRKVKTYERQVCLYSFDIVYYLHEVGSDDVLRVDRVVGPKCHVENKVCDVILFFEDVHGFQGETAKTVKCIHAWLSLIWESSWRKHLSPWAIFVSPNIINFQNGKVCYDIRFLALCLLSFSRSEICIGHNVHLW